MKIRFIFNDAETIKGKPSTKDLRSILTTELTGEYSTFTALDVTKIENIVKSFKNKKKDRTDIIKENDFTSIDSFLKKLKEYKEVIDELPDSKPNTRLGASQERVDNYNNLINSKYFENIKKTLEKAVTTYSTYHADNELTSQIDSKLADNMFAPIAELISDVASLTADDTNSFAEKYKVDNNLKSIREFIESQITILEESGSAYKKSGKFILESYAKHLAALRKEYKEFSNRAKIVGSAKNVKSIIDRILSFNNMEQPSEIDNLVEMMKKYGDSNANADNVHESALKYILKLLSKIPEEVLEDSSMNKTMLDLEKIKNSFEKTIKTKDRNKEVSKEVANAISSGIDSASKLVGSGIKVAKNTASKVLTGKVGIDK